MSKVREVLTLIILKILRLIYTNLYKNIRLNSFKFCCLRNKYIYFLFILSYKYMRIYPRFNVLCSG